jgi:hypothetical protein
VIDVDSVIHPIQQFVPPPAAAAPVERVAEAAAVTEVDGDETEPNVEQLPTAHVQLPSDSSDSAAVQELDKLTSELTIPEPCEVADETKVPVSDDSLPVVEKVDKPNEI